MSFLQYEPCPPPKAYVETAPALPPLTPLQGEHHADVAVVGGGVTGLSAALHLAERGARVALLEAHEIGWGGSGRAFGQIVPYTKHSEAKVLEHFGLERGDRLIAAAAQSSDLVFDLIEHHGIACDAHHAGILFAAHSSRGLRGLERRAQFWQDRNQPVFLLDPAETAATVGTSVYRHALLDRRGGTLNPFAFARGLASAAVAAGATIHAEAPMRSTRRTGNQWLVESDRGCVLANRVIWATDSYSAGAVPALADSLIKLRAYQLVTAPLPEDALATILPGRQSMTDTRRLFSGIRVHPSGRLHVSVDGPVFNAHGKGHRHQATARVRKLFPQIRDFQWDEEWSGWVAVTTDEYPRLLSLGDGRFGAFGYSGRGLAMGTLLGRELARHITGNHPDDLALPLTPPKPAHVRHMTRPLVGSLISLYRLLDRRDERRVSMVS